MSGRTTKRATLQGGAVVTVNERILRDCHKLYTDPDDGLVGIAQDVGTTVLPPRKKIIVMLIGNHSAGKSTFINWYLEEHVQKTGVAIETQGFVFVTSGKKRESLTGNATMHLYPEFEGLKEIQGVTDYLSTEISTSKQKKFPLVTFVDTPGLVDGDMKYPFDVNQTIQWMGAHADLIFVFFDPIGQALCKRTLNIVEHLNENYADKLRFYLAKADEAGHESDRQRVLMQIVQELCKRPGLNKTGFDMPTIYVPNPNRPSRCVNQIDQVCQEIERTINRTIQNTLNTLEKDCVSFSNRVDQLLAKDELDGSFNFRQHRNRIVFGLIGFLMPLVVCAALLLGALPRGQLNDLVGKSAVDTLYAYLAPVNKIWTLLPADYVWHIAGCLALVSLLLLLTARYCTRTRPRLTRRVKTRLRDNQEVVRAVLVKKQRLYDEYLKEAAVEHEI